MPAELLAAVPQLAAVVEKLGIVGVLLLLVGFLGWDRLQRMKELAKTYRQRDRWRLAYTKCKAALDAANIKVDLSDLSDLVGEESSS